MAEVITSGKVIQKPEIVLERTDFLPPGLLGVRTQTRDEAGQPDMLATGVYDDLATDDELIVIENPGDTDNPDGTVPDTMPVPQDMRIVSQTLKVGVDRKITVDVVIETSDFPGIREFEARVTKSQL